MLHLTFRKLTVLFLLLAPSLFASNASQEVIVPIVARAPGAFNSLWRSDLVIANVSRPPIPVNITIQFMRDGQIERQTSARLEPRMTVVLEDAVSQFGLEAGAGLVRVVVAEAEGRVTARARIFNAGSPVGEFGQNAMGLPFQSLGRRSHLAGVSGAGQNRTNVGVANPQNIQVDVLLSVYDQTGVLRGARQLRVGPRTVVQVNDIFGYVGVSGFANATVEVNSTGGVYAYASVVRSDSGDAIFVNEVSVANAENEAYRVPECVAPAGIFWADQPAPGWIVVFEAGVDATTNTQRLASALGFTPQHIYTSAIGGFAAVLTTQQVATLRCDPTVRYVAQNGVAGVP